MTAIAVSDELAVTGGTDGRAKVWSLVSGTLLTTLRVHGEAITHATLTVGHRLVTAALDGSLRATDVTAAWALAALDPVAMIEDAPPVGDPLRSSAHAARDSSSCPPATSVRVVKASAKSYRIQISARNTCRCRIYFNTCSPDRPNRCTGGRIGSGETREFMIDTTDGKAHYNWRRG